jgi:stalled ribosome alternative rescue factor ArfA
MKSVNHPISAVLKAVTTSQYKMQVVASRKGKGSFKRNKHVAF